MRKILVVLGVLGTAMLASTSCRMAPREDLGDTVEARIFEPREVPVRQDTAVTDTTEQGDSVDVGLSRKDTTTHKGRP